MTNRKYYSSRYPYSQLILVLVRYYITFERGRKIRLDGTLASFVIQNFMIYFLHNLRYHASSKDCVGYPSSQYDIWMIDF